MTPLRLDRRWGVDPMPAVCSRLHHDRMTTPPRTTVLFITSLCLGLLATACAADDSGDAAVAQTAVDAEDPAMGAMAADDQEPVPASGALSVDAIDHAIVLVDDLDDQVAFYSEMLGWQQIAEGEANRLGLAGGIGLNLVQSPDQSVEGPHTGVSALGFRTTDLAASRTSLQDAGIEFTEMEFGLPDGTVNDVLSFADPEGNTINLVQPQG